MQSIPEGFHLGGTHLCELTDLLQRPGKIWPFGAPHAWEVMPGCHSVLLGPRHHSPC